MADQWFYTCNGKQMEPVPIAELRKLAASGFVKPTDLVWQDGMPNWIRASAAKGLFEDEGGARLGPTPGSPEDRAPPQGRRAPDDGGRRRPRRGGDYFDQDPDRPSRRASSDGLSAGAKVAIILGVVVVVVGSVVGGIVLLVNSSNNGQRNNFVGIKDKAGKVGAGPISYTATIHAGNTDTRTFEFKVNTQYEFHITRDFKGDLDFYIRDQNNFNDLDQWISVPNNHRHNWVAPYTGNFRVELIQMGNGSTKATVNIREIGPAWGKNIGNFPPPNIFDKVVGKGIKPPPPAPARGEALTVGLGGITKTGTINQFDALDPGGPDRSPCHVYLVRMEQGFTYQIDLQSKDFDAFLRIEDSNFVQLAEHDDIEPGIIQDARIQFNCDRSANYRIVCRPLVNGVGFGLGGGRYTLTVKKI